MKAIIVIKGSEDRKKIRNIKAHCEMQLSGHFDKIVWHNVNDSIGTEVVSVRTSKENFNDLKMKLDTYYPNQCLFIERMGV